MGDTLCSGFFYLFSCCCFCSPEDPGSDGSGFCSSLPKRKKKHRDPREKALKREFMEREYRRDEVGHIHIEAPPGKRESMIVPLVTQDEEGGGGQRAEAG